jgi:hypothetical protein
LEDLRNSFAAGDRSSRSSRRRGCGFCGRRFFTGRLFALQIGAPAFSVFHFIGLFAHNSLHYYRDPIVWRTMRICWNRFNIYLLLVIAAGLICGCHTAEGKHKKQLATLRLYQETNTDPMGRTEVATVHRDPLVQLIITKAPFLTEAHVKEVKVVDTVGGVALSIQFNRQGNWLLEQYTAAARGKHIAVFSQFVNRGEEKLNVGRWLAAPKIATHITDGLLTFTPDATREEAEQIALGLNNVAKKVQSQELQE